MPVLPLVGSMMTVSFFEHAALLGVFDHRHADAVLDAAERIEEFALEQDGGVGTPAVTLFSLTAACGRRFRRCCYRCVP